MSKFSRLALAAFAAVGIIPLGAQAATLTLDDPNCQGFSVNDVGNGGISISCNVAAVTVPVCSLATSASNPAVGTQITLTATCSQSPTSYAWSGCTSNTSTSNTCTITGPASAGSVTYGVTASNAAGQGAVATVPVNWGTTLTAPNNCVITPNPLSLVAPGGPVTLTASCAAGGAATNFAWSGGSLNQNGGSNQAATSIAATTTFSVVASNSAGTAPSASTTVIVATGTGGGGNISCAAEGYAATRVLPLTWSSAIGNVKVNTSGFGPGVAIVVPFTTPALTSTRLGNFNVFETTGLQTYRLVTLSSAPCGRGTVYGTAEGTTAGVYFAVGGPVSGFVPLATSTTYYLTIVNRFQGQETCGASACEAQVELGKPKGL